jgi:heme-degrading monooxygenase HmoA
MGVMEIARITCQDGRGDEFIDRLKAGLQVQGADAECTEIYFQRGVENPNEFFLHLVWTSVEAHNTWRTGHREEWRAHIVDLLDGMPQLLGHYEFIATVKPPVSGVSHTAS